MGPGVALDSRESRRSTRLLVIPIESSPSSGVRQIFAVRCQL